MASRMDHHESRIFHAAAGLAALAISFGFAGGTAFAADAIFAPDQPIVTGFSGVVAPTSPPPGTDPLDRTFIDPDGDSLVIENLKPAGPPKGQLINSPVVFRAKATDVGQVFGVALDDAPEINGAAAPNIYVAATSAYGLNIVVPDADGNPVRSKQGAPDATFMPGQWGDGGGTPGYPGSIWKIDGVSGEISLFSTIAPNTGAGLGDIAFDPASQQFFVSDLDSGLIYRLASDGTLIDSFDHGVDGRPTHGLDAVADDGSAVDITDPAFNSEDPSSWGITQTERKVWGLGLRGGRLYYAAADGPSVWSVKINPDGSFGTARWELDVAGLASGNEITHIVFDPQGRMILAQRGAQMGSYDYSGLADPGTSSVARYAREFPDDPSTPSTWVETPDTYAIGFKPDGSNATGGVALGYGYDKGTQSFTGACGATLWATGESLRDDPSATPPLGPPAQVAGLQGNAASLVRPANDPPRKSVFTDFDGNTAAAEADKTGHVGAVAIWQDCSGTYVPPAPLPPPGYTPPEHFNLSLDKWASPHACIDGGTDWWCHFTIRVENTGTVPYWGPITVNDSLPASNPGASLHFWPAPPWACSPASPTDYECTTGPDLLFPGDTVDLNEVVKLPKAMVTYCDLPNVANIDWGWWDHDDDPADDFGFADAKINAPGCVPPPPGTSNLKLKKVAAPFCTDGGITWDCSYAVIVQNAGPANFSGPITVTDTLGVNAPATTVGPWACVQAGPVLTCNIAAPPINAPPGWTSGFLVTAHVKKNLGPPLCSLDNKANIATPPGGTPINLLPGDDFDHAKAMIPDPACFGPHPHTDLKITKSATGCAPDIYLGTNGYTCGWTVTVTNVGPNTYNGPLTFKDASGSTTHSSLQGVPLCSGSAQVQTCAIPAVSLASGVPHPVNITTFYPDGPSVCSVSNNVSILTPNPGSTPNPAGNDSDSAAQAVPNPACNFAAPKLNITKTGTGCASDPSGPDWLCDFDVVVKNYGGSPQPAPIKVTDNTNGKPTTFTGAACVPSGPSTWLCTRATPLNAGQSWAFQATAHVDPNGVTLADCNVINTVHITTPASADPGYAAQASEKVPQLFINVGPGPVAVYCDPPSLKLKKLPGPCVPDGGGFDCNYTVVATSTGPDPYHGTVELDEVLPDGTSFKASTWTCVPTTGNDVHCSSNPVDLAVGQSTGMKIAIFVPRPAAIRNQCAITNTVNAAISAAVLHSAKGVQYTASATDQIPADLCAQPPQCSRDQLRPDGNCCPDGTKWNGKLCVPPVVVKPCPRDSSRNDAGACECKDGTHGVPGRCVPDTPVCAPDSVFVNGECVCKPRTHGDPGQCVPDNKPPVCPKDSTFADGQCQCKTGTTGDPGQCVPLPPVCAPDSIVVNGQCVCKRGSHGDPGQCAPDNQPPACPKGSSMVDGQCQCNAGTIGVPPRCIPIPAVCPDDSHQAGPRCVCNEGTIGRPGQCRPVQQPPACPKDSTLNDGECRCNAGTHGTPGQCAPDQPAAQCPDDSHFDRRANACMCNRGTVGTPGACTPQIVLQVPRITIK